MPKILRLDDNTEIDVAEQPEWRGGVLECGDQRFTDPQRDLYEAVPEPEPVPVSISPRQIRQALTRAGLRASVEAAVAAGDQDLKDWWEYSTVFERGHAQVSVMADALGVSSADVDDLWRMGGTL